MKYKRNDSMCDPCDSQEDEKVQFSISVAFLPRHFDQK